MLAKPDEATYAALARMSQSTEWGLVEKWLRDSREACVKQSLNESDARSRQAQGGFFVLDELFDLTQKARDLSRR